MSNKYQNILVAVDGSKESEWALQKSIELSIQYQANLHLVHIVEFYRYPGDAGALKEAQERHGTELLEKYKAVAENAGAVGVNTILEFGSPKYSIPRSCREKVEADLIICGATGINAVERIFIGSVSENIARAAKCDVLIVRTPTTE